MKMKTYKLIAILVSLCFADAVLASEINKEKPPKTQVIAYYFHGTTRCETCLKIEKFARETIERRFPVEITTKQMVFKSVNYDLKENAHFLHDYKLPCPSLVVARQKSGKDEKWKLLDKTWEHIGNLPKFNEYVIGEIEKLMQKSETTPQSNR